MCRCVRRLAGLRQPPEAWPCAIELPRRWTRSVVASGGPGPGGSARAPAPVRGRADHRDPGQGGPDPMTPSSSQFQLPVELEYIEATIPPGMAIAEYRRAR